MESSVKKIDKNILRVIWGNEETYHPGDQFLPEVMERTANECQIQAEAAEDGTVSIFGKDGKLLTKETACTLTAKEVFRYTFTGKCAGDRHREDHRRRALLCQECRYGKSSRCL